MECKWKISVFKNWFCFHENGLGRFIGFSHRWKMFIMCKGHLNVGITITIYDWKKKLSIVALENLSMIELILNNWVRISIDLDKLAIHCIKKMNCCFLKLVSLNWIFSRGDWPGLQPAEMCSRPSQGQQAKLWDPCAVFRPPLVRLHQGRVQQYEHIQDNKPRLLR